ncbi:MAG: DUF6456 domain-containing protein [Alphaproteobacteria bacterium]
MTLEDEQLIRRLAGAEAFVDVSGCADVFPAFPKGNKRRKPVCWVERAALDRLLKYDVLTRKDGQVTVSRRMKKRYAAKADDADADTDTDTDTDTGTAAQHRDCETRDIYTPDGVLRPAIVNHRTSVLRSIARKRKPCGNLLLSAAQVEAGEQFAKDYAHSGIGFVSTQNYNHSGADGGARADAQEYAIISRMDRRRRVSEAISCLGPGLDRALIAVCCEDWSLDHLERTEKWAKRSGITVLKLALDRLVKFYGTVPGESGARGI